MTMQPRALRALACVIAMGTFLACGRCGGADVPDVHVHGATDALTFRNWEWADDEREQLVAEIDADGEALHDVICIFYDGDERIAVDGIPGSTFDEPGRYRRRFPIARGLAEGEASIGDATRVDIFVNETEQQAHRVAREQGLVPQGTEAPPENGPSRRIGL